MRKTFQRPCLCAGVSLRLVSPPTPQLLLSAVELQARVLGAGGSCVFSWSGCSGMHVGRDGVVVDANCGMSMTIVA